MRARKLISAVVVLCLATSVVWCGDSDCRSGKKQENCAALVCSLMGNHSSASDGADGGTENTCSCVCHLPSMPAEAMSLPPLTVHCTTPDVPPGDMPATLYSQLYRPPIAA
jgi:hypothetical protein